MAAVKIYRNEAEDDLLPHVCMKCGQPATHFMCRTFWSPHAHRQILSAGFLLGHHMTVNVPLCDAHHFHWFVRKVVTFGGFAVLLSGIFVGVCAAMTATGTSQGTLLDFVLLSSLVFGSVWMLTMVYLSHTQIRTYQLTQHWLLLVGVSEEFRDALEEREYQRELDSGQGECDGEDNSSSQINAHPTDDRMREP